MDKYTLYLDSPASEWELASPVGCGEMGAMVYGGTDVNRVQLSHERIWAGDKIDACTETFRERIEALRRLLLEGRGAEADAYANTEFADAFHRVKSNETAGDLLFLADKTDVKNYRRELDLLHGISAVTWEDEAGAHAFETLASYPDRVILMRRTGVHSLRLRYCRPFAKLRQIPSTEDILAGNAPDVGVKSITIDQNVMTVRGVTACGLHEFTVKIRVTTDGTLTADGSDFVITDAADTVFAVVIGAACDPEFPAGDYETLRARSASDTAALMERADIDIEGDSALDEMSVDKRIERLKNDPGAKDPALAALYARFGRYLLVGSSRPGTLPAHLQGVWNCYIEAPWNTDYHTNINLQMNYWHAEVLNLSECALPLFDYMNDYLLESGRETARVNYKCRGTVVHHLSDLYGYTAPADGVWGLWPLGAAWLCQAMWEHYLFTGDRDYLKHTAYTYIHDCARFFLDYMFEQDGVLLSGPSTSPENRYFQDGKAVSLCLSPSMDVEIIGFLLRAYAEMEDILGIEPEMADEARAALAKMPSLKVGKHGQLMEWMEDYDEPEPGHRHVSHLFALYPDAAITPDTPDLFAAAKRSLERRLANGGGHTGWSCAWLIALHARLLDQAGVADTIRKLLTCSTRGNLFDSHPPFQIDGNFGATAAIAEALVQSHNGRVTLLPACPDEFARGSMRGICLRGGAMLDASWENGKVTSCKITAARGDFEAELCVNGETRMISLKKGEVFAL